MEQDDLTKQTELHTKQSGPISSTDDPAVELGTVDPELKDLTKQGSISSTDDPALGLGTVEQEQKDLTKQAASTSSTANPALGHGSIHEYLMKSANDGHAVSEQFHMVLVMSKAVKYIRRFLSDRYNFNEILNDDLMAPLLYNSSNHLSLIASLEISPQAGLRNLVIGRVFDRGFVIAKKVELGMSLATCELCMGHANYEDLMELMENMVSGMVKELTGGYTIKYHANGYDKEPVEIDFTPPFRRIEVIRELENLTKMKIPSDLSSHEARVFFSCASVVFAAPCPAPGTTGQLFDKLVEKLLKDSCMNPTFIINHPAIMSPLAKVHGSNNALSERFELVVNKHGICNGFTMLNNPLALREPCADQLNDGLPPSGSCGLEINRLVSFLTEKLNINVTL